MKSVLISIKPKWVEKIYHEIGNENGKPIYEKVVEVRKSKPNLETPFKCYIYCTNGDGTLNDTLMSSDRRFVLNQKVIGEFVCDKVYELFPFGMGTGIELFDELVSPEKFCKESCLTEQEICDYIGEKDGYGWHISNLKIYDKPKELSEFAPFCEFKNERCELCICYEEKFGGCCRVVTRPPQSWCYIESLGE